MKRQSFLAAALTLLLAPSAAFAHATGRSYSDIAIFGDELSYFFNVEPEIIQALAGFDRDLDGKLEPDEVEISEEAVFAATMDQVRVFAGDQACSPKLRKLALDPEGGRLAVHASYLCPAAITTLKISLPFLESAPAWHRHLFKLERTDGQVEQHVLSPTERELEIKALSSGASTTVMEFIELGVEHILIGYDHIFFLLGLLVATRRVGKLLGLVSAFTLGHTITLILATLISSPKTAALAIEIAIAVAAGALCFEYAPRLRERPQARAILSLVVAVLVYSAFLAVGHLKDPILSVELLISISVIFVGVENFFLDQSRRRWVLALAFGLVHGFGFASVLSELHLPSVNRLVSLVAFNVGVEVGQLIIVSLVFPPVLWTGRRETVQRRMVHAASAVIALGGLVFLSLNLFG